MVGKTGITSLWLWTLMEMKISPPKRILTQVPTKRWKSGRCCQKWDIGRRKCVKLFEKSIQLLEISSPLRDTMCFIYYNSTDIFLRNSRLSGSYECIVLETHLW